MASLPGPGAPDARREPRTNLFLAAQLLAGGRATNVKVRDMSSAGALVEGTDLPPDGSTVRLERGPLGVGGRIVWSRPGRCGLAFDSPIAVEQWMPGRARAPHQAVVDRMVAQVRSLPPTAAPASPVDTGARAYGTAPDDPLAAVSRAIALVDSLNDALGDDADVVLRHGTSLQQIDLALQLLRSAESTLSRR